MRSEAVAANVLTVRRCVLCRTAAVLSFVIRWAAVLCVACILSFTVSLLIAEDSTAGVDTAAESSLYSDLYTLYYRWRENFYGADRFYYHEIQTLLYENRNTLFTTPRIFMRIEYEDGSFSIDGSYRFSSWLHIRTPPERNVAEFYSSLSRSERILGTPLALSGTIDRFAVQYREQQITLYLHSVRIIRPGER